MATQRKHTVVDTNGIVAKIRDFIVDDTHTAAVLVELPSGARVTLPSEVLHLAPDGGYAIDAPWQTLAFDDRLELPVVEEHAAVRRRAVVRESIRVRRKVVSETKVVETPVVREHLIVERVPRDEVVQQLPEPRHDGDMLVIPIVEEEVVVSTRLRLVEELRVRVIKETRIDRQTVTLRRHDVDVDHTQGEKP